MKRIAYRLEISIPLRKIAAIGEMEDSLNQTFDQFGLPDKLAITSTVPMVMTVNREITEEQKVLITDMTEKEYAKAFGSAKVKSFERAPELDKEEENPPTTETQ